VIEMTMSKNQDIDLSPSSSGVLGLNGVVIGGGAGAAPTAIAAGITNQVLHGVTGAAPSFSGLTAQDLYQTAPCVNGQVFYDKHPLVIDRIKYTSQPDAKDITPQMTAGGTPGTGTPAKWSDDANGDPFTDIATQIFPQVLEERLKHVAP
jgi:hypothetical protein